MKKSTRLIVAIFLVVILSVTAIGVWAAPARVELFLSFLKISRQGYLKSLISVLEPSPFKQMLLPGIMKSKKLLIHPPNGLPPEGWVLCLIRRSRLPFQMVHELGTYLFPQARYGDKNDCLPYWNPENSTGLHPDRSDRRESPMICGTGSAEGHYALLGK
jgi:hypothetical protein